jgi:fatty acid kinase fatty acid binding subunit
LFKQIRNEETGMIGIITDSTCDIPDDLIDRYGIIVIPQVVIWGEQQLRDRHDIQSLEFYERLLKDPVRPHSSLPAVGDIQNALHKAISSGANQLIVLTVSSAMSGTFGLVQNTAHEMDIPVSMVDSKGPTMSLGWQVLAAARARDKGDDLDDVLEQVAKVRGKLAQLVAMDSLEHLQRGGRLGGAVRWVGTMLRIKPLVTINHLTGVVEPVSMARTHKALVELLYNKFFEKLKGGKNLHIAVLHGNAPAEAGELVDRIRKEYQPAELLVNMTGPVLGINTGPGALALCGYAED